MMTSTNDFVSIRVRQCKRKVILASSSALSPASTKMMTTVRRVSTRTICRAMDSTTQSISLMPICVLGRRIMLGVSVAVQTQVDTSTSITLQISRR